MPEILYRDSAKISQMQINILFTVIYKIYLVSTLHQIVSPGVFQIPRKLVYGNSRAGDNWSVMWAPQFVRWMFVLHTGCWPAEMLTVTFVCGIYIDSFWYLIIRRSLSPIIYPNPNLIRSRDHLYPLEIENRIVLPRIRMRVNAIRIHWPLKCLRTRIPVSTDYVSVTSPANLLWLVGTEEHIEVSAIGQIIHYPTCCLATSLRYSPTVVALSSWQKVEVDLTEHEWPIRFLQCNELSCATDNRGVTSRLNCLCEPFR